ncbi:hypothetical protein NSQ41_10075 [Aeribacillus sp. FSL K6-8210]
MEKIETISSRKYKSFHNLYIPKHDGTTSQIDHRF